MNTKRKIRVGFIGCGSVSELHYQGLLECETAELAGICDIHPGVLRKRENEWKVKAFDSLDDLLHSDIDAVFVLTPIDSHYNDVMSALHAGKHVLVEKPISTELHEIDEMIKLSREKGLQCMPAHNYIYSPDMYRLKKNILRGNLGRIAVSWILYHVHHGEELCARYPGIIRQVGIHLLYTQRFLFGAGELVSAVTARVQFPHLEKDDQAMLTFKMPDGSISNLFASFAVADYTTNPWSFVVKVLGTGGCTQLSWQDIIFDRALGTLSRSYGRYEETYEHEIRYFINECVLNNRPPLSTLEDAAEVLRMVIRAENMAEPNAKRYES